MGIEGSILCLIGHARRTTNEPMQRRPEFYVGWCLLLLQEVPHTSVTAWDCVSPSLPPAVSVAAVPAAFAALVAMAGIHMPRIGTAKLKAGLVIRQESRNNQKSLSWAGLLLPLMC